LFQIAWRDQRCDVEDRACRRGDRDPAELADVAAVEVANAVNPDPRLSAGVPAGHGHVDISFSSR
jgi:hypothetical protein